jgi:hypothetical protein
MLCVSKSQINLLGDKKMKKTVEFEWDPVCNAEIAATLEERKARVRKDYESIAETANLGRYKFSMNGVSGIVTYKCAIPKKTTEVLETSDVCRENVETQNLVSPATDSEQNIGRLENHDSKAKPRSGEMFVENSVGVIPLTGLVNFHKSFFYKHFIPNGINIGNPTGIISCHSPPNKRGYLGYLRPNGS